MAPEQARSARDVDHRSDIYALCVLAYYLLTGSMPFMAESGMEIFLKKEAGDYVPAGSIVDSIPPEIDAMLARMMATDPQDRFQSAENVIDVIDGTQLVGSRLSFV